MATITRQPDPPTQGVPTPGRWYFRIKRAIDVLVAGVGLVLVSPMLLGSAAYIMLRDGRPFLYCQWRVGRDGELFRIFKLRTMRRSAEARGEARFAQRRDPRVIPGCTWMRRCHLDELPQLWNILLGDMSLVGPRPERPEMIEQIRRDVPDFEQRLAAVPGLTGLAQVRQGYTNDIDGARTKLAYDLQYLAKRSVAREVVLMLATLPRVWDRLAA